MIGFGNRDRRVNISSTLDEAEEIIELDDEIPDMGDEDDLGDLYEAMAPPPSRSGILKGGKPRPVREQPETNSKTYYVISSNQDDKVSVEVKSYDEVLSMIEEMGENKILAHLNSSNPALWLGRVLIIRGEAVAPRKIVSFKLEAI